MSFIVLLFLILISFFEVVSKIFCILVLCSLLG